MQLFSAEAGATATSAEATVQDRRYKRPLQVVISLAATVTLEGRVNPSMPWVQLAQVIASGYTMVDVLPEIRATIAGNTGTVDAALGTV